MNAYVFPTLDPTKPPIPVHSRMKSCISLFSTHLRNTHPGKRGFGLIESVPFFNFLLTCTDGMYTCRNFYSESKLKKY